MFFRVMGGRGMDKPCTGSAAETGNSFRQDENSGRSMQEIRVLDKCPELRWEAGMLEARTPGHISGGCSMSARACIRQV